MPYCTVLPLIHVELAQTRRTVVAIGRTVRDAYLARAYKSRNYDETTNMDGYLQNRHSRDVPEILLPGNMDTTQVPRSSVWVVSITKNCEQEREEPAGFVQVICDNCNQ